MNNSENNRIAIISLVALNIILLIIIFSTFSGRTDLNDFLSIIGTIITSFAFLIGCYFAVLAVSAYSHHREIEKIKSDVVIEALKIDNLKNRVSNTINDMIELMIDFINEQIKKTYKRRPGIIGRELENYQQIRRGELFRKRALAASQHPGLNHTRRENLMRELSTFGKRVDIAILKEIEADEKESEQIRKLANEIIEDLKLKKE